jgi:hypothetical protein
MTHACASGIRRPALWSSALKRAPGGGRDLTKQARPAGSSRPRSSPKQAGDRVQPDRRDAVQLAHRGARGPPRVCPDGRDDAARSRSAPQYLRDLKAASAVSTPSCSGRIAGLRAGPPGARPSRGAPTVGVPTRRTAGVWRHMARRH